jgi:hypothetical protein
MTIPNLKAPEAHGDLLVNSVFDYCLVSALACAVTVPVIVYGPNSTAKEVYGDPLAHSVTAVWPLRDYSSRDYLRS